jgi:hypothetical protein
MSKFVDALTNLVRQIMRKFAQGRAHYYMDRVASTSDGRMYSLSNGTDAIALNGGKFLPGESVLVIRADTGQQFLYYFNPTNPPTPEEEEALTVLVIMYYTATALKYALVTPNGSVESSDLPLMSATMTLPTGTDTAATICLYRGTSATFSVYNAFALPENIISFDSTTVTLAVSAASATSTFNSENVTGSEYLGTGTASMSAFTDDSETFAHTVVKEPAKGLTGYVFTSNARGSDAVLQQTYPLVIYSPSGTMVSATSADYTNYPWLMNYPSLSCYGWVSGAEYAVGEYTSGTTRGGIIFKRDKGVTYYQHFTRESSADTEFTLTPSGTLISKGYMRTLADMSVPPSALTLLGADTDAGAFAEDILQIVETGTTSKAVGARSAAFANLATFSKFPESYTRYETSMNTYQVHRHTQHRGFLLGGTSSPGLRTWNGGVWGKWLPEVNGQVYDMAYDSGGNLWVCGNFTAAGNIASQGLAYWDGTAWHAPGDIDPAINGSVLTLAFDNAGNVWVGGNFTAVGGVSCGYAAMFDGTWHTFDFNRRVSAIANYGGVMIAGGFFDAVDGTPNVWRIAKYTGGAWSRLGGGLAVRHSGVSYGVTRMLAANGVLYIGGTFYTVMTDTLNILNGIATWDGSVFAPLGSGLNINGINVTDMAFEDSKLYLTGAFELLVDGTLSKFVTAWEGASWVAMGMSSEYQSPGRSVCKAADGSIYAIVPYYVSGVSGNALVRWTGSAWQLLDKGTSTSIYRIRQEA